MVNCAGRSLPLSLPRRLIGDLLYCAHRVPSIPVQRHMNLAQLVALRAQLSPRPSWAAIFLKAYGQVARARPELRRAYLPYPWPHLYEFASNRASVAVERSYRGEQAVFFAHVRAPEEHGLCELDDHLRRFKTAPIESIGTFRLALRISRLPLPLRRLLWWATLHFSGYWRMKRFGTFGLTVYSGLGAESLHPRSPLSITLTYGIIGDDGQVTVRLIYDHRAMDGAEIARALGDLEKVLNGAILAELREICAAQTDVKTEGVKRAS